MSAAGPRPAGVVQFVRRPLWWAGGVFLVVAFLWLVDLAEARRENDRFGETVEVTGEAIAPWKGDGAVLDVRYVHPATGRTVEAATAVRNHELAPVAGATAPLEVSRHDPSAVAIAGERFDAAHLLPLYTAAVLLPLLFWGSRSWQVRRTESLMATPTPSFAMSASVEPPHGFHRRWRVLLYPVDGRTGAAAVCAASLITLPTAPGGVFPVEVKGVPRPFGSIAVRAGEQVLWLRGRALARAVVSMPERRGDLLTTLPMRRPAPTGAEPNPWWSRGIVLATVLLAVFAWWSMGTTANRYYGILDHSHPTTAVVRSVIETGEGSGLVSVTYVIGGEAQTSELVVDSARAVTGQQVAVRYSDTAPGSVWLQDSAVIPGFDGFWPPSPQMVAVVIPAMLVLGARFRDHTKKRAAAVRLLSRGHVDAGFPPTDWFGVTMWNGSLAFRPDIWSGSLPIAGMSNELVFAPDALLLVTPGSPTRRFPWSNGFAQGDEDVVVEDDDDAAEDPPALWWLVLSHQKGGAVELDIVTVRPPLARRISPVRGPSDSLVDERIRVSRGSVPDMVPRLARRIATEDRFRTGIADPGRALAFVALLVADNESMDAGDRQLDLLRAPADGSG